MGIFFREFDREDGETIASVWAANFYQGARSVGGRLALTNRAVLFEPNWLDYALAARGRRFPLANIRAAEVEPAQVTLNPHKARARVRIWTTSGSMLVAVRDPYKFAETLNSPHG